MLMVFMAPIVAETRRIKKRGGASCFRSASYNGGVISSLSVYSEVIIMGLIILRCVFLLVAAGVGVSFLIKSGDRPPNDSPWMAWAVFAGVLSARRWG